MVKNSPANTGDIRDAGLIPPPGKIPWRRAWQPIPVFLPGESHGQRSLAGCSPWGRKEADTPEQLSMRAREQLSTRASAGCVQFPARAPDALLLLLALQKKAWAFWSFCILLSLIWLNCACRQLFSVPYSYFVFCCWRRCLSRCKPCSKVSPGHLLSNTRDLFACSVVR